MKKIITILAIIVISLNAEATIRRCNNNPGISGAGIYSTIQAAHNAANVGDTIHLEPSPNSYGTLTMTKRLFIVSTGGFLQGNPGMQYSPVSSYVDNIFMSDTMANNSVLSCGIGGYISLTNGMKGVQIKNCYYSTLGYTGGGYIGISNCSNILVINNGLSFISITSNSANVTVLNNIFGSYASMDGSSTAIIENNVFFAGTAAGAGSNIYNSTVRNNIFLFGYLNFTNSIVQNNMNSNYTGALLPSGNNNINSATYTNIFNCISGTQDTCYTLKAGSPAIGTGFGGVDMGAFAGSTPYTMACQARIPAITNLVAPAVPTTNTINVNFSTKSN